MTNPVTAVVDYLISLFGPDPEPQDVRAFVNNPLQAAQAATGQAVTAAQLQTAYTAVAPASAFYGGGDPIEGMQRAVAHQNGLAFMPQTEALSNNDTLSHNDTRLLSPETNNAVGPEAQQGVGNFGLEFGDITFGDKSTNTATDGGVVNTGTAGDIDATSVEGDGNVVGDDNENVNTGDVETGDGSPVVIGEDNDLENSNQQAGGDIVQENEGPVINDVDMSGGNGGGAAGGDGGGGLIGIGNDGGDATGGAGGAGGGIVINDNDPVSVDASHDDNSVDNSVDNSDQDNSVDNSQTVDTDVNVSNDVGIF